MLRGILDRNPPILQTDTGHFAEVVTGAGVEKQEAGVDGGFRRQPTERRRVEHPVLRDGQPARLIIWLRAELEAASELAVLREVAPVLNPREFLALKDV